MCIFQSDEDIPPTVRISLRTLQYLVIPLLSLSMLLVGLLHLGECPVQPLLPVWHVVGGVSGLCTPIFYLLFDDVNPWMSRRLPAVSEFVDNVVVFLLPLYVTFEIGLLIAGSVWTFDVANDPAGCDRTIHVFSLVVVVNFWIHILTPLAFVICLGCSRIFPYCAYCAYWNVIKKAVDRWTLRCRMSICVAVSAPLGLAMVTVGALSVQLCNSNHSPAWLMVAGSAVLVVPVVYLVYDKYCKEEREGPLIKSFANGLVITFLMFGLTWAVVGFIWVFGLHADPQCGADSFTYRFAFCTIIVLNVIMDIWICFKICIVLYWAFLGDDS